MTIGLELDNSYNSTQGRLQDNIVTRCSMPNHGCRRLVAEQKHKERAMEREAQGKKLTAQNWRQWLKVGCGASCMPISIPVVSYFLEPTH